MTGLILSAEVEQRVADLGEGKPPLPSRWPSLAISDCPRSTIARKVTGTSWNGFLWVGPSGRNASVATPGGWINELRAMAR